MHQTDVSLPPPTPRPDDTAPSPLDAGGAASASEPAGAAGALGGGGKPSLTIPEIADTMLLDYWGYDEPHGFALRDGRTLTYDVSGLGPKGTRLALAAMREWGEATGIAFEPGGPTAPDVVRRPEDDPLGSVGTAAEMGLDEGVTGWIGEGDRDWVRVEVEDEVDAVLRVEGMGSHPLESARLAIRDEEGQSYDFRVERAPGAAFVDLYIPAGTVFYADVGGRGGDTGLYRLTLLEARRARADIVFADDEDPGGAFASDWRAPNGDIVAVDVNVPRSWLEEEGARIGGFGFQTYLHEVGHALGLGHPGAYNDEGTEQEREWDWARDAEFAEDSWQATVMSYFSQEENLLVDADYAHVVTPMAADIEAVRALYGLAEVRHGDTVYGEGTNVSGTLGRLAALGERAAFTIHDTGGHDVIKLASHAGDQRLDLRPGRASDLFGKTGNAVVSLQTEIEDVGLGAGDDRAIGNRADNALWGGGGHDRLSGGAGADALHGWTGDDWLAGNEGDDVLGGGAGDDRMWGGSGADALVGEAGEDTLGGGSGDDRLRGGVGDDILRGGAGGDLFVFAPGWGDDRVLDFGARVASEAIVLLNVERVLQTEAAGGGFRAFREAHLRQDGEDVVIDLGPGSLRLEDVAMSDLDAGNVWL